MRFVLVVICWLLVLVPQLAAHAADIRSTPHNLTRQGAKVEPEEVCVFCHTPQLPALDASRSAVASQPAWQPSLDATHSFVLYDDIGRLQFGNKPAVGSQSIACLSCHDSNQAFSVQAAATDHPFGIPYRGFSRGRERTPDEVAASGEAPSRAATEIKALDDFRPPSKGHVDNRTVWWVSASGVTPIRTRNDLPLYVRNVASTEVPFVECSSCHDPHTSSKLFLRVDNAGSRLCLTCHSK